MTEDIKIQKNLFREKYKKIRSEISKDQKALFDKEIFERVISLSQYKNCQYLFTYVSIGSEADTLRLIQYSLSDGKKVAVPKCGSNHGMDFYIINSLDDLEKSSFGLLEPKTDICMKAPNDCNALCIVPAVCFDVKGCRIGYGGGYYDRFLSGFLGDTVGICYHKCLCGELPKDIYDISVNILVTENAFHDIKRSDKI